MPGRSKAHYSVDENQATRPRIRSAIASLPIGTRDGLSSQLQMHCSRIFGDAQLNTAGHRKLAISLRKIQESCVHGSNGDRVKTSVDLEQYEEADFNAEFARCVTRLMTVKKGEMIGDKLVRFIGLFLKYSGEKDVQLSDQKHQEYSGLDMADTPTSRLASHLLSMLTQFLSSREKTVRYRATQMISHVINSLDTLDEDCYRLLRENLLKRIRDKEAAIRVQAVIGLGRLAGNEEDDLVTGGSDNEEAEGLTASLLEILQNDPSAEVRRTLLLNLPLTPSTLPFLLERARDLDASTRRALYSRLLPSLGDFRHLSLSMREKLLRWGLRDRDENVQKATARLFRERWIDDCAGAAEGCEDAGDNAKVTTNIDALLELLERIDVINSGMDDGIGGEAMKEFWNGRPDYRCDVGFNQTFWESLTPESAFMARTLNDFYCSEANEECETPADGKFPEITELASYLQQYIDQLITTLRASPTSDQMGEEEITVELEFEIEQMLHIAQSLDYSDEIGRRKMFTLMRQTLATAELPEGITKLVVDVLCEVCNGEASGEQEFCGVVFEAISEVHETIASDSSMAEHDEDSFHSARSELDEEKRVDSKLCTDTAAAESSQMSEGRAIREIVVNMKCLHIAQCMLQNVEGSLQSNMHLVTMLNNLIVPAVRSHEAPVRERGLLCLGLCCLLDKALAEEHLTLFLHCFSRGHGALQVTALHTVADILQSHPTLFRGLEIQHQLRKTIVKAFSKGLKSHQAPEVQMAATVALCKLMLVNVIKDEDLLTHAVTSFFDPATKPNVGMRQALTYSLPVFSYSKKENMEQMARIAERVFHAIIQLNDHADDDDEIVNTNNVCNVLIDWTDARRLVVADETHSHWSEAGEKNAKDFNTDAHLVLADNLLQRAMQLNCPREERKTLLASLGKLHVSAGSTQSSLESVRNLVTEAVASKAAGDASSRAALNKLYNALNRALGQVDKPHSIAQGEVEATMAEVVESEYGLPPMVAETADCEQSDEETAIPEQDPGVEDSSSDQDELL